MAEAPLTQYATQTIVTVSGNLAIVYSDAVKADGSTRPLDGTFTGRGNIPDNYNPELPTLVNP